MAVHRAPKTASADFNKIINFNFQRSGVRKFILLILSTMYMYMYRYLVAGISQQLYGTRAVPVYTDLQYRYRSVRVPVIVGIALVLIPTPTLHTKIQIETNGDALILYLKLVFV